MPRREEQNERIALAALISVFAIGTALAQDAACATKAVGSDGKRSRRRQDELPGKCKRKPASPRAVDRTAGRSRRCLEDFMTKMPARAPAARKLQVSSASSLVSIKSRQHQARQHCISAAASSVSRRCVRSAPPDDAARVRRGTHRSRARNRRNWKSRSMKLSADLPRSGRSFGRSVPGKCRRTPLRPAISLRVEGGPCAHRSDHRRRPAGLLLGQLLQKQGIDNVISSGRRPSTCSPASALADRAATSICSTRPRRRRAHAFARAYP